MLSLGSLLRPSERADTSLTTDHLCPLPYGFAQSARDGNQPILCPLALDGKHRSSLPLFAIDRLLSDILKAQTSASILQLQPKPVGRRIGKGLANAKVSFCRLDTGMAQRKLNLVKRRAPAKAQLGKSSS